MWVNAWQELYSHASYFPKSGCKCKVGALAWNQVIIQIFKMWTGMVLLLGGWRLYRQASIKAGHIISSLVLLKSTDCNRFDLYFDLFLVEHSHEILCVLWDFWSLSTVHVALSTLTFEDAQRRMGQYRKLPEQGRKLMVDFQSLKEKSIKQMDAFNTIFLKCLACRLKKHNGTRGWVLVA